MKQSESCLVPLFACTCHSGYDGAWSRSAQAGSAQILGNTGILSRHVDNNGGTTGHQTVPVRIVFPLSAMSADHKELVCCPPVSQRSLYGSGGGEGSSHTRYNLDINASSP